MMSKVDVIIPTYKPDKNFIKMLELLEKQTVVPEHIIIFNTEEKYFDQFIFGSDFLKRFENVKVYHHSKWEYDHGNSRNRGVKHSDADIFVMMTQDAMPADSRLIEDLIAPIERKEAAVAYARQLPTEDCHPIERFTRAYNYPEKSRIKGISDVRELGIKAYFCSDTCAAYNRAVFDELGGFIRRAIFNEDMIFAAGAMKKGYRIAYVAKAQVIHSHNYTIRQQFQRNFDNGVSHADHPEVFEEVPAEGEGIKMVKATAAYLWKNHQKLLLPRLFLISGAKWLGFKKGCNYKKLSEKKIMKYTFNRTYWKQRSLKLDRANIDEKKGYGKNPEKEGV